MRRSMNSHGNVFAKVRASGQFGLMLVDDLQMLHETFSTPVSPAPIEA